MNFSRKEIATLIAENLSINKKVLQKQFLESKKNIGFFYLDALLPEKLALEISNKFPKLSEAEKRKNFRENKYIAYQMDKYNVLLEEVIYAFQDKRVVALISEICNIDGQLIPLGQLHTRLKDIPRDKTIIVYCKFGKRGKKAVDILKQAGINNCKNLAGGIMAWIDEVQPNMEKY